MFGEASAICSYEKVQYFKLHQYFKHFKIYFKIREMEEYEKLNFMHLRLFLSPLHYGSMCNGCISP